MRTKREVLQEWWEAGVRFEWVILDPDQPDTHHLLVGRVAVGSITLTQGSPPWLWISASGLAGTEYSYFRAKVACEKAVCP